MCTLPANDWPSSWPHDPHQSNKEADNSSGTIQWRGCFGWFRKKAGTWQRWRDKRAWQEDKGETRTQQRLVHVDGAKIQVVNCAIEIDLRLKSMLMRFFFKNLVWLSNHCVQHVLQCNSWTSLGVLSHHEIYRLFRPSLLRAICARLCGGGAVRICPGWSLQSCCRSTSRTGEMTQIRGRNNHIKPGL